MLIIVVIIILIVIIVRTPLVLIVITPEIIIRIVTTKKAMKARSKSIEIRTHQTNTHEHSIFASIILKNPPTSRHEA